MSAGTSRQLVRLLRRACNAPTLAVLSASSRAGVATLAPPALPRALRSSGAALGSRGPAALPRPPARAWTAAAANAAAVEAEAAAQQQQQQQQGGEQKAALTLVELPTSDESEALLRIRHSVSCWRAPLSVLSAHPGVRNKPALAWTQPGAAPWGPAGRCLQEVGGGLGS